MVRIVITVVVVVLGIMVGIVLGIAVMLRTASLLLLRIGCRQRGRGHN